MSFSAVNNLVKKRESKCISQVTISALLHGAVIFPSQFWISYHQPLLKGNVGEGFCGKSHYSNECQNSCEEFNAEYGLTVFSSPQHNGKKGNTGIIFFVI